MKNFFVNLGYFSLLAFWLGPWALLLVEGATMFLTGHVLTSIPWDQTRVGIALAWPMIWGFIAAGIFG